VFKIVIIYYIIYLKSEISYENLKLHVCIDFDLEMISLFIFIHAIDKNKIKQILSV
jgi:hypothetical protein